MSYLDALQMTLAAEHASVFVLGYLGAQTSASGEPRLYASLREAYDVHRSRRDQLVTRVLDAGGELVAAAASYELEEVAGISARINERALRLERDCGETYGFLVANSPSEERRWAIDALLDTAQRELGFGGEPRTYPGR